MSMQENKQEQYKASEDSTQRIADLSEAGFNCEYCDGKYAFLVFEGANKMAVRRMVELNPENKKELDRTNATNNNLISEAIKIANKIRTKPETIDDIQERAEMLKDMGLSIVAEKLYEKYPKKENAKSFGK